jgi:hypothetical protein
MRCQILVPIKGRDHIEEFLPYLEDMARPDTTIVFLVHVDVDRFSELTGQLLTMQSAKPGDFPSASLAPHDRGESQSKLTQRLEHASRELRDHGVQIEVKFYSGRLRPVLRQYNEVEAKSLVIMRPAINRAWRWLRSLIVVLGIARPSSAMPVRLCHPADFTSRDL